MAIFGPKTQNIKNPEMCVPAASQDTTYAKKSWENINFEKSYSITNPQKCSNNRISKNTLRGDPNQLILQPRQLIPFDSFDDKF